MATTDAHRTGAPPLAERAAPPERAQRPGSHLGLVWRTLDVDDAGTVLALLQRCEAADAPVHRAERGGVVQRLEHGEDSTLADSLGGFDARGVLRAAATVHAPPGDRARARMFIAADVDPDWRARGLGRALLTWQDDRARQLLAELRPDLPGRIGAHIDDHLVDRRRLFIAAGFTPTRFFHRMRRSLDDEVAPVAVPAGIRLVPWDDALAEDVRAAHNAAFVDHWGSEPVAPVPWQKLCREIVAPWSRLAIDETSSAVVGYALTTRHAAECLALGHDEGFVELLGVQRAARGSGVARSLLGAVLTTLREHGVPSVALEVDSEHPAGAQGLYRRMGFEPDGGQVLYTVEL